MTLAPRLVLGTMYFGTRLDDDASFQLLDRFVAAGGRWIDTANCYAFWESPSGRGGQSEAVIGRWLTANPGVREQVLISTKVGREKVDPNDWDAGVEGQSAEVVARAIELSLERLQTDHVDLYWAHGEDRETPDSEQVQALTDTVVGGLARRIGLSNHPAWRAERFRQLAADLGREGPSALQNRYTYLQPRAGALRGEEHPFGVLDAELLDLAAAEGWDVWAYSPLMLGAYDREDRDFPPGYRGEANRARLAALTEVANELGVTRGQVVLAWLVGGEQPIWPILGVSSTGQLDEGLRGVGLELTLELSQEHLTRLESA
ncbi:MAG: aldo/keto reductase [bacterium]|nr:aldo/keto reductase [bacterium]